MKYSTQDQAAALAGVFQAATLVDQLARTGQWSEETLTPSIHSIFVTSPDNVAEVYGGFYRLSLGKKTLTGVVSRDSSVIAGDVIRYALAMIHLEKKLSRKRKMLNTIAERLQRTQEQVNHFGLLHDNVMSALASIYLDTLSTFKTRITVAGDTRFLQDRANANRIRATLLAGIRSATLWRQCGGSRWHLFVNRKSLIDGLQRI